ncbi:MAG: LamG domain-containing protein, partial [Planctomycetes bacterium]|nr:LamG domain-containing protein [Planctomycetota bacterium]
MTRAFGRVVRPLSTLLCALFASAALGAGFDEQTLLLALFDASLDADYARGSWQADSTGTLTRLGEGRRGAALMLRDRARLDFAADGNLNPLEGTIEFWLKPSWPGNDPETHSLFSFQASALNFLNINSLPGGRLGVAVSAGKSAEDRVWRRVDADISGWKPGEWHHVAAV